MHYVEQYQHIQDVKKATGSPYFANLAAADARLVQALAIVQQEMDYADAEIKQAINR